MILPIKRLYLHTSLFNIIYIIMNLFYLVPAFGVLALLYTFLKSAWVTKQEAGNDRMREIATYIAEGAMAFLKAEYKVLG